MKFKRKKHKEKNMKRINQIKKYAKALEKLRNKGIKYKENKNKIEEWTSYGKLPKAG
jgi:hypothetical protein